jgi:MOSC domain-containing protein
VRREESLRSESRRWRVRELWRYPVKSLGGERCERLHLGSKSVLGDRVLAILDVESGRVLSATRDGLMLEATAHWSKVGVTIVLPDGQTLRSDDERTDGALSHWLGRSVRLVSAGGGRRWGVSQSDPEDASSTGTFLLPGGRLVDEAPVHLVSSADLQAGEGSYPRGEWDVRRFRPNLLLEGEGWNVDEAEAAGLLIRVGA